MLFKVDPEMGPVVSRQGDGVDTGSEGGKQSHPRKKKNLISF